MIIGKSHYDKGGSCKDQKGDFWIKGLLGIQNCLIPKLDREVCELKNEYKRRCPIACHSCAKTCEDSYSSFVYFSETITCKEEKYRPELCDNYWFAMKCPYTCNFCPLPSDSIIPTDEPSLAPSLTNSPVEYVPKFCHDVDGAFPIDDFYTSTSTCKKASNNPSYCRLNDTFKRKCPITCDSCPICKNNKYQFRFDGEWVRCRDAGTRPKLCDSYAFAKNCAFKCNFCPKPPTISPHSSPSPASLEPSTPSSISPSTTSSPIVNYCHDVDGSFPVDHFHTPRSTCKKAAKNPHYCKDDVFKRKCPITCDSCPICKNSKEEFKYDGEWVTCRDADTRPMLCDGYDFAKNCAYKCNFCPRPPTIAPHSIQPTPTVAPSPCEDKFGRFPVDDFITSTSTCKKARQNPSYCDGNDAFKRFCPETCDSCPTCENTNREFLIDGQLVKCADADYRPGLCDVYKFAKKCSIECDFCESSSPAISSLSPSPSISTTIPSFVDDIPPTLPPSGDFTGGWSFEKDIMLEEKTGEITALSDNSQVLVLSGNVGELTTYTKNSLGLWVMEDDFMTSYDVDSVALSRNGTIMIVSSQNTEGTYYISVLSWDGNRWTDGGKYRKQISSDSVEGASNPVGLPVAISDSGNTFAVAAIQGLMIYDFNTDMIEWTARSEIKVGTDATQLAISADGTRVAVNRQDTTNVEVYEYRPSGKWNLLGDAIEDRGGNGQKAIFARGGNWLIIADWKDDSNRGAIYLYQYLKIRGRKLWRMQGGDAIVRGSSPPKALGWDVDISNDGSLLLYSQNGLVKILRWEDEKWINSQEFDDVGLRPEVELSGNGRVLISSTPLSNPEEVDDELTSFRGETNIYELQ